jgi:hypothetical protein
MAMATDRDHLHRIGHERLAKRVRAADEEQRQVPERPHDAQQEAGPREAEAGREARQRIASPAQLFARLHRGRDCDRERQEQQRLHPEARPVPGYEPVEERRRQLDGGGVAECECPPPRRDADGEDPRHEPARALSTVLERGEGEGRERRGEHAQVEEQLHRRRIEPEAVRDRDPAAPRDREREREVHPRRAPGGTRRAQVLIALDIR